MSNFPSFDAIGFAGGGNRCYWQSGFLKAFSAHQPLNPRFYVTVSAGAYHCAMFLAGIGDQVRGSAFAFAERRVPDLDWSALRRGRSPLVVGSLFRQFLTEHFDEQALAALKRGPPMLIQLARPPRLLPGTVAALGSILAYQIEKALTGGAHSRAGLYLGLKPVWISSHDLTSPAELVDAIMATSSVPPFMPVGRHGGVSYLDGGLVDNPPLIKLRTVEQAGGRTLLLTTRFGKRPPPAPNRAIVGPSTEIAVNKFTVGDADGIRRAFAIGLEDGAHFVERIRRGDID